MSSYARWAEEEKRRRKSIPTLRRVETEWERRAFESIKKEVSKHPTHELVYIVTMQVKKIFDKLEPEQELSVEDAMDQLKRG